MANARFARFMVTFTVPADDYKHKHVMVVHHIDDELDLRRHYAGVGETGEGAIVNPSMEIVAVEKLKGTTAEQQAHVRATAEAAMKESGDEYRPLDKSEMLLNQEQVDNLRADFNELLATHGVEAAGVTAGGGEV
jgi:hypothetical protein